MTPKDEILNLIEDLVDVTMTNEERRVLRNLSKADLYVVHSLIHRIFQNGFSAGIDSMENRDL